VTGGWDGVASRKPNHQVRIGTVFWVAIGIKVLLSANTEKTGKLSFTAGFSQEEILTY
jgi:hypothetical protein